MAKKPYNVKMRFSYEEYVLFDHWYENDCYKGLNSFAFPKIDSVDKTIEREYRFVANTSPKYVNVSARIIECTMQWEEV